MMNEVTSEELVELVNFNGEEYLFYKAFPLDVALLRGTTADEDGNITFEKEGPINEGLAVAQAAKNSGGIVIVQVEYRAKRGTMHPKEVKIPGALVEVTSFIFPPSRRGSTNVPSPTLLKRPGL